MTEKKNAGLVVASKQNALQSLASRLHLDPETMKKTLKATAFKECKTDEEFVAALIVANEYGLNPLTKEIYAFAAKQGGGVVPVVSTDGWTNLMVNHPNYRNHWFVYSENIVTMKGAKPCPEWCEIHIEKKDGTVTITREYLDEVFRELSYSNPWQSHTKRFLRHKTKIQGARETFGFGGIYDQDEAERIIEAQIVDPVSMKPDVDMPKAKSEEALPVNDPEPTPKEHGDAIEPQIMTLPELLNLPVKGKAEVIQATIISFSKRIVKKKTGVMSNVVDYLVGAEGISATISAWGDPINGAGAGMLLEFRNIDVSEFNEEHKYTAHEVVVA